MGSETDKKGSNGLVHEAYTREIPLRVLLLRMDALLPLGPDLRIKILAYLRAAGSGTFVNTAEAALPLRLPVPYADARTLHVYLWLRRVVRANHLNPYHLPLTTYHPNERYVVRTSLRHQILSIIGISNDTNTRLSRLVGQGPWLPDTDFVHLRRIMDETFHELIAEAVRFTGRGGVAYLTDLSHVCMAWASVDGWARTS